MNKEDDKPLESSLFLRSAPESGCGRIEFPGAESCDELRNAGDAATVKETMMIKHKSWGKLFQD